MDYQGRMWAKMDENFHEYEEQRWKIWYNPDVEGSLRMGWEIKK